MISTTLVKLEHIYYHSIFSDETSGSKKGGTFLASLHLQNAYYHVPINIRLRKYLAFAFAEFQYWFKILPFGLNIAPRVFTKLMMYGDTCSHVPGRLALEHVTVGVLTGDPKYDLQGRKYGDSIQQKKFPAFSTLDRFSGWA